MRSIALVVGLLLAVCVLLVGCRATSEGEAELGNRYSIEHQAYLPLDDPYWQEKEQAEGAEETEPAAPEGSATQQ